MAIFIHSTIWSSLWWSEQKRSAELTRQQQQKQVT